MSVMAALRGKQVQSDHAPGGCGLILSFGPFSVDAERRSVTRQGAATRLTLKCTELLLLLAQKAGCEVTKEELIEAAWGGPDVSDATLAQHIFLLRRELRGTGVRIETVRGIGYRLDAQVTRASAGDEREISRDLYLREAAMFREFGTDAGLRSAIDLYGRAIALNPSDAYAYAGRASCRRMIAEYLYADPLGELNGAHMDAMTALACDPENVDARVEAAFSAALRDRDIDAARAHLEIARAKAPAHPLVAYLRVWLPIMRGSLDEALRVSREGGGAPAAMALYFAGRYAQAASFFERTSADDPTARIMLGACKLFGGDPGAAVELFEGALSSAMGSYALAFQVYALGKGGEWLQARKKLTQLEAASRRRYVSPMVRAVAHLGLGDREPALHLIEEAVASLDPWTAFMSVDPLLRELHGDPRFDVLAERAAA